MKEFISDRYWIDESGWEKLGLKKPISRLEMLDAPWPTYLEYETFSVNRVRIRYLDRGPMTIPAVFSHQVTVPVVNIICRGAGEPDSVGAISMNRISRISSDLKRLAHLFVTVRGALELVLLLGERAQINLEAVAEEIVAQDEIVKVISELSRYDLIEVSGETLTLTSKGKKLATKLQERS